MEDRGEAGESAVASKGSGWKDPQELGVRVSGGVCSPQQASKVVLGFSVTVEHTILTTLSYSTPPNEPHKPNYGDGGAAFLLAPDTLILPDTFTDKDLH